VTFTPTLSLQLYAQPFLSAGKYARLARSAIRRAGAEPARIELRSRRDLANRRGCAAHRPGAGRAPISLDDPNFTVQLNSNAVLRWEYRPGRRFSWYGRSRETMT
jgi:hypothetical protein